MKTFSQRWKYFVGLGFAGVLVFSGLFAVTPVTPVEQTAYAACAPADAPSGTNCADIRVGCPGSTQTGGSFTPGATYTCPYPPLPGSSWICPAALSLCTFNNSAPSIPGGQGPGANSTTPPPTSGTCGIADIPAGAQVNCANIPAGCPGSFVAGPFSPTGPAINCPYPPKANSGWTCPVSSCGFGDGAAPVAQGQAYVAPSESEDSSTGCDFNGNPLTWFICPVVGLLERGVRQIDGFIMSSLEFDTAAVFGPTDTASPDYARDQASAAGYKTAWNSFRIIASAILIIAGLIMISSSALGFEVLDAYTIKKTLPKILIAALFINLSWIGMRFVIEFFNTFGFNLRELIYSPFANFGTGPDGTGGDLGGSTLFVANVGAIAALAFLGPMALLTFLFTALLAVLVGFLIIIVRNLALIVLIVLAPVGIAAWILPNTQKMWNLWKDNFLGLLLLFPIISAFIAIGRVFSAVSLSGAGGGSTATFDTTVAQIIGFVAYFLPYFMLPIAFRLATGVIGSIAGFVNDRNKGAFDRLKKYRGNKMAENSANMAGGTRFNNKFGNALTSRAANATSSPLTLGLGRKGRQAYQQKMEAAGMADAKGRGSAIMFNDEALRAGTYSSAAAAREGMKKKLKADGSRAYSDETIENAIAANNAAGGFGRSRQVYAAKQLATTGTGYTDIEDVASTIARASNGDANQAAAIAGFVNSETKKVSRGDLAPGAGTLIDLARNEVKGGADRPTREAYAAAKVSALRGRDPVSQLRDKPQAMRSHAEAMHTHAAAQLRIAETTQDATVRDNAMKEFVATMGTVEQYNQSKSYASPENQAIVNDLYNKTQSMRDKMQPFVSGGVRPTITGPDGRPQPVEGPAPPPQYEKEWKQANAGRYDANDPRRQDQ